jgi:alpha-aminoadipic semialdehyde synthase
MTPPITIGIRRENDQKFEARTPLIPDHVRDVLARFPYVKFLVQPSRLRVFSDTEYIAAGVTIQEDLSAADIILCIKEVYPEQLIDHKTYLVFAHVIKGQMGNMWILQELLNRGITLVDYECITNHQGQRTVFFGRSAGHAGMLETLRAFGQRLKAQGKASIFSQLKPIYEYPELSAALAHLDEIAAAIQEDPNLIGIADYPIVFAIAGMGNLGQGAAEIFDHLPHQTVQLKDLEALAHTGQCGLFKCELQKANLLRNSAGLFNAAEYDENPFSHQSILPELLPHISVLLNCVFYAPQFPKILPQPAFRNVWMDRPQRLQVVGDLSCDPPDGSVACSLIAGDLYHPAFDYDPITEEIVDAFSQDKVTVMAVDNLCAGLPVDASVAFSTMLMPYLESLIHADWAAPDLSPTLPPDLQRAVVTHQNQLTERFRYLQRPLQASWQRQPDPAVI